jgi:hypothetical protein
MTQATGAPPSERRARLPPNPSNTLTRPEQQKQQQRAAEQAVRLQDVLALQRAVGSPPAVAPQDDGAQAGEPGQAATHGQSDATGGLLSNAVLQTILDVGEALQQHDIKLEGPACDQPQRVGPKAAAGLKASPPHGSPSPGAAPGTDPAALAAYLASLQGSSNMLQRQLAHLHAAASGGGAPRALPVRSARHASGRRELFVLSKWLEVETQRFNATHSRCEEGTPLVDFLMLAAARARAIYGQAYAELARHVSQHCEERGRLMADVWIGYGSMLDR